MVQERGLPDPGLAAQHEHTAPSRASVGNECVERCALDLTTAKWRPLIVDHDGHQRSLRTSPLRRNGRELIDPGVGTYFDAGSSVAPQDAEAAGRADGDEAVGDRALPDPERCLPALGRILEHVVEHERAAGREVAGPPLVVGERPRRTRGRRRRTPARAAWPSARRPSATARSPRPRRPRARLPRSCAGRTAACPCGRCGGRRGARRGAPTRPGSPPNHGGGRRCRARSRPRGPRRRGRSRTSRSTCRSRATARARPPRGPASCKARPSSSGMKPTAARAASSSRSSMPLQGTLPRHGTGDPGPRSQPRHGPRPRHRGRRARRRPLARAGRQERRRRCRGRRHAPRPQLASRWRASSSSARARRTKRRCSSTARRSAAGGPACDIAVDPIDGTTLTSLGRNNAISVIAIAERGTMFDPGPCVYMDKIAVGPEAADVDRHRRAGQGQPRGRGQGARARRSTTSPR